ncbi:unnamed protein product, partial [Didymodactylos carnosus]
RGFHPDTGHDEDQELGRERRCGTDQAEQGGSGRNSQGLRASRYSRRTVSGGDERESVCRFCAEEELD